MFCIRCGKPLLPGSRFCSHCGTPAQPAPANRPTATPYVPYAPAVPRPIPSNRRKSRVLWGALAVFVAVAIILGGLFASGVFSPGNNKPRPSGLAGQDNGRGLTLGRETRLLDQDVRPSGTVLTVQDPKSQLNGLEIHVPDAVTRRPSISPCRKSRSKKMALTPT